MLDINRLRSAKELKGKIKELFTDQQLEELARNYGLPHYVLTNPIEGKDYIYFIQQDINEWIAENCIKKNECKIEQTLRFLHFNADEHRATCSDAVPPQLSRIRSLFKLPIDVLSTPPGIYFLCEDEEIVYVGQALNVARRIGEHMTEEKRSFNQVYFIPCLVNNLLEFESALIRWFRPRYNFQKYGPANERDAALFDAICRDEEAA